jgi:hypothetical protein
VANTTTSANEPRGATLPAPAVRDSAARRRRAPQVSGEAGKTMAAGLRDTRADPPMACCSGCWRHPRPAADNRGNDPAAPGPLGGGGGAHRACELSSSTSGSPPHSGLVANTFCPLKRPFGHSCSDALTHRGCWGAMSELAQSAGLGKLPVVCSNGLANLRHAPGNKVEDEAAVRGGVRGHPPGGLCHWFARHGR